MRTLLAIAVVFVLAGCAGEAAPLPDIEATVEARLELAKASLVAPTAVPLPTYTPMPAPSPEVVVKEVVVEKEVPVEVQVIKEVEVQGPERVVTKEVPVEVQVIKEVEVIKEIEVQGPERVVTREVIVEKEVPVEVEVIKEVVKVKEVVVEKVVEVVVTATPTAVPTYTPTPASSPTPIPTPISLTGSGQQASDVFSLGTGLHVFEMTHQGDANFAIFLMNEKGEKLEMLVNKIGNFDGSKAIGIAEAGNYILDVTASGNWSVEANTNFNNIGGKPISLTGSGQQASDVFSLGTGLHVFEMTHQGDANFAIWLMNEKGEKLDLLVNKIGDFDGSKAVGIIWSGNHILDVIASGNWSVEIK